MDKEYEEMVLSMEKHIARKKQLFEILKAIEERDKMIEKRKQAVGLLPKSNSHLEQKIDKASKDSASARNIVLAGLDAISTFGENIDDKRFIEYKNILQSKTPDEMEKAIIASKSREKTNEMKQQSNSIIDFCDGVIHQAEILLNTIDALLDEIDASLENYKEEEMKEENMEEIDITATDIKGEEVVAENTAQALKTLAEKLNVDDQNKKTSKTHKI